MTYLEVWAKSRKPIFRNIRSMNNFVIIVSGNSNYFSHLYLSLIPIVLIVTIISLLSLTSSPPHFSIITIIPILTLTPSPSFPLSFWHHKHHFHLFSDIITIILHPHSNINTMIFPTVPEQLNNCSWFPCVIRYAIPALFNKTFKRAALGQVIFPLCIILLLATSESIPTTSHVASQPSSSLLSWSGRTCLRVFVRAMLSGFWCYSRLFSEFI